MGARAQLKVLRVLMSAGLIALFVTDASTSGISDNDSPSNNRDRRAANPGFSYGFSFESGSVPAPVVAPVEPVVIAREVHHEVPVIVERPVVVPVVAHHQVPVQVPVPVRVTVRNKYLGLGRLHHRRPGLHVASYTSYW